CAREETPESRGMPCLFLNKPKYRASLPHARAKKLPRAAKCLVYSLTPSGVLAENDPRDRGFVGILRGQKCLKRRFSRRSPVGEWSRGLRRMGGVPPLGYRAEDCKLVVMDSEAEIVRAIFRRYAELGSVRLLKDELEAGGLNPKSLTSNSGRRKGGEPLVVCSFPRGALYLILQNRISRGSGSPEIKLYRRGRRRARPADCGYPCQNPEASSARRETTLQREIAVKNVSLGIFDPARCRRNPDFWGGFPPKPRSVLRNRQGIPRLSRVSSRAPYGAPHC